MIGYIYKITCLVNGKIYVGQTIQTLQHRLDRHGRDAIAKCLNHAFARAIRKHGIENFYIEEIERYMAPTRSELKPVLDTAEKRHILYYNSYHMGYNSTYGGDGKLGLHLSDETKAKIGKSRIGKKHSNVTKDTLRKARTGSTASKEAKAKMSCAQKKRWESINREEFGDKMRACHVLPVLNDAWRKRNSEIHSKRVAQYSLDGKLVNIYTSAVEANIKTGVAQSSIGSNCRGTKYKSAGGYIWKFAAASMEQCKTGTQDM